MPPAVPNEPAPAAAPQPTAKRQAVPASRGPSSARADFRQELVRQRKPAPKPRDDAKSAKPAAKPAAKTSAKPSRGQKPRRPHTSGQNDAEPTGAGESAAQETADSAEPTEETGQVQATESADEGAAEAVVSEKKDSAGAQEVSAATGVPAVVPGATSVATSAKAIGADEARSAPLKVAAVAVSPPQTGDADGEDTASADIAEAAHDPDATGESSIEQPVAPFEAKSAPRKRPQADGFGEAAPRPGRPDASGETRAAPPGGPRPEQAPSFDAALAAVADAAPQDDASNASAPASKAGMIVPATPAQVDPSAFHSRSFQPHVTSPSVAPSDDALPPEARFAAANHESIVKEMRAEVLPGGGTMRLRLDPPQLGALQVTVQVRDGLVTAAFETSNDQATRLLGHSLNQLKTVLESHGVAVDKLQVQQASRDERSGTAQDDGSRHRDQPSPDQEHAARQEQQRREMLRRMWRRLSGVPDPLDVTG